MRRRSPSIAPTSSKFSVAPCRRSIRRGAGCTGVATDLAGARASFADGSEIEADVIVGADGIHSIVRTSLFGPDTPRFTGCICRRGLVPVEAVPGGALRRYEQPRIPRTRRAQLGSRERAKENHLTSPRARLRRDFRLAVRTRFGADKTAFQAAWLYDYDVAAETANVAYPIESA
ncbi:MAG: salicylate 1-monooxygenase [Rhodospirillales bacterium]|nr:salicylate 1-monooxygenase [Rhodospirillales bacterium]